MDNTTLQKRLQQFMNESFAHAPFGDLLDFHSWLSLMKMIPWWLINQLISRSYSLKRIKKQRLMHLVENSRGKTCATDAIVSW